MIFDRIAGEVLGKKSGNNYLNLVIKREEKANLKGSRFYPVSLNVFKNQFFAEFNDYIKGKFPKEKIRDKIVEILKFFIPDAIFIKWLDISLEKKLVIFDLLLLFFPNISYTSNKNPFKNSFERLLNLYSVIYVYISIVSKFCFSNLEQLLDELSDIERIEEHINLFFFNMLTKLDFSRNSIVALSSKLDKLESAVHLELNNGADRIIELQKKQYLTSIKRECNNFYFFFLLSRPSYETFYEWFLSIEEKIDFSKKRKNSLYKDLGLS